MPRLPDSLRDWNREGFVRTLTDEIRALPASALPLDRGLSRGGLIDHHEIAVTLLSTQDEGPAVRVKVGLFYREVIGGCSCGDDPESVNAYCEMNIRIDKATAEAEFSVLDR